MKIIETVVDHLKKELPFVAYKKPNTSIVSGFFQRSNALYRIENYTESGFVFAPFDHRSTSILIPEKDSDFISETYKELEDDHISDVVDQDDSKKGIHEALVAKTVKEIKGSEIQKIVISRKEQIDSRGIDVALVFQRLLKNYPAAMVYIWYHPAVGLWIGATPETLVKIENNIFSTMSLAATRPYEGTLDISWNDKELTEQLLVTQYIAQKLQNVSSEFEIHDRETVRAGNVVHLRTLLTGHIVDGAFGLGDIINALHPTPAVCGMPRELAREFILREEGYDRKYYTGFLGELNRGNTSELFVNLRCMEVEASSVSLYVGGGITAGSIPEKEWKETQLKSKTLKNIL